MSLLLFRLASMGLGDLPQAVVREPKALLHGDNCLISGEDLLWQALLCVCVCVCFCVAMWLRNATGSGWIESGRSCLAPSWSLWSPWSQLVWLRNLNLNSRLLRFEITVASEIRNFSRNSIWFGMPWDLKLDGSFTPFEVVLEILMSQLFGNLIFQ